MADTLVAYFSATGSTERLAHTVAQAARADLYEIKPAIPYSSSDLNWNNSSSRSTVECKDASSRPAIAGKVDGIERYKTVFIGFPIWWYTAPPIIKTFLESYDFSGKNIVLFATSGGSGMGRTESNLEPSAPGAIWKGARRMAASESLAAVKSWVDALGV